MADSKDKVSAVGVAEANGAGAASGVVKTVTEKIGKFRWKICGLLFFATTLNYIDRQVLGLLKPRLWCPTTVDAVQALAQTAGSNPDVAKKISACFNPVTHQAMTGIGLTDISYGYIVMAFSIAYAIGLLFVSRIIDRIGLKMGYAIAVVIWGAAAASHSLVSFPGIVAHLTTLANAINGMFGTGTGVLTGAVLGFGIARFFLGLGESGNFPACIKSVAEWFPQKERALATGIFNSGANVGALIAPLAIPFIADHMGWRWGFLFTAAFSAIWIALWLTIYRNPQDHPKLSKAELEYINSGTAPEPTNVIPWSSLIPKPQAWAIFIGKLLTDPVWWFYLYWLPGFLNRQYGLPLGKLGLPIVIIYNVSAVGSIYGGWLPGKFISMGWSVNKARKTAMFIYAVAVLPVVFVGYISHVWGVIALMSLAAAAHQAWSANMFTLGSDMFPRRAVASIIGLGTFGAAVLMAFISILVGYVLQWTGGNYKPLFIGCGLAYLIAFSLIHLLAPKLKMVEID
jgi:ACS family hexuronate transporter-like MFS transporter